MTDTIDPRLPHRVTDEATGKKTVFLGKVGFNMGTRRAGEPRETPEERDARLKRQLETNLKG